MRGKQFYIYLSIYLLSITFLYCNCAKVKKNKKLRSLLKSLTERVDTNDGENEYARLTQTPIVNMKLSKTNFKTSLQNTLVESYAEKVKEFISKTNYEINKEKNILDEIKNSNYNLNKVNSLLSIKSKNNDKSKGDNKLRNIFFHYLEDYDEDFGLSFFPVYKTFKSNLSHFNNNLGNSLLPHELLDKGLLSSKSFSKNSSRNLFFPERGDIKLKV
ncbi:conserved Plasmodium protein, unknown function [Plasmodium malariae]|uniref:Uncharacterized protein n=1 Tax=Plasmodium malariae TaxID=5858 RepID=A0A1C3KLH8_PLAMA|nr:conserved Plasmodium protein, unknown function [Plasmodium malariae]